jgi:hypothetical protein
LGACASAAEAQLVTPAPGADEPYTLVVDVLAKDGAAVLAHYSFKCKSFLITCQGAIPFTVDGKAVNARVYGRADDALHLEMHIEAALTDEQFDRAGFGDRPTKRGQEWEGELSKDVVTVKHVPKTTETAENKNWRYDLKREQTHTVIAKARIRIEE